MRRQVVCVYPTISCMTIFRDSHELWKDARVA